MMITRNDDIIIEILLRLPAKSLIRFKLVSKHWLCMISSHYFSRLHTTNHRLSKPELSLLLRLPQTPHRYYYLQSALSKLVPDSFPTALEDQNNTICSSSNGALILLRCAAAPQECHVYNPTTRQSRKIALRTNEMYPIVAGLSLVFDPLTSPGRYKIICVRFAQRRHSSFLRMGRTNRSQIEVYESDTDTWKFCGDRFFAPSDMDYDRGIYWNNGVHWGGIFFDFDRNVVHEHPRIVVPDGGWTTFCNVDCVQWKNSLFCVAQYPGKKSVAMFELQKDCSEWVLRHRIDLDADFGPFSVLSMVGRYNNEEDCALLIHQPEKIMAYKFVEKRFEVVIDLKEEAFHQDNCVQFTSGLIACQFFETLALV